jgi:rhodanese-related sulfurtransferase
VLLQESFRMAGYQEIESNDLYTRLSQEKVLLVDVRNNDETSRGVIHGALCIPLHLLPLRLAELAGDVALVFYCHSGVRSAHACSLMANQGRNHIYNLRGGILAWGNAGYSLEPKN